MEFDIMKDSSQECGVRQMDPMQTARAAAFASWINAPMPMVTLFYTLDVTRLVRLSKRGRHKFNMLLCWCIGKAASKQDVFYLLPVDHKLIAYERIAVNTVVATQDGGIQTCDVPFDVDLVRFEQDYLARTRRVAQTGQACDESQKYMVIGTSALVQCELDGAVNLYAGCYNNPFVIWGKYRRHLRRITLPVSFQFHHTQMDGAHAAKFLNELQTQIKTLHCELY